MRAFNCPHCNVYAKQIFYNIYIQDKAQFYSKWQKLIDFLLGDDCLVDGFKEVFSLSISTCEHCNEHSLWVKDSIVYPKGTIAPEPVDDMPGDVKEDFLEARLVLQNSPRSAAALLRLALQKLMPHLGMEGKRINDDINELMKKGLSSELQEALDVVRVIGNESVHPGELDMHDDIKTALALFNILNWVVESKISPQKMTDELLHNKIPKSKLNNIINRKNAGK